MTIAELYRMLCRLYRVEDAPEIEHYLLMAAPGSGLLVGHADISREALLVRETPEALELGLFVDPAIVAALEEGGALTDMDALACAAEGASHFLYVADRAAKERRVSCLELELQGEVDKFLLIHLIAADEGRSVPPELFERQFEHYAFGAGLSPDEIDRYATASHFAAKYCAWLKTRCFNPLRRAELERQARGFFELDFAGKVARLLP